MLRWLPTILHTGPVQDPTSCLISFSGLRLIRDGIQESRKGAVGTILTVRLSSETLNSNYNMKV
jgi:hypothetical protein